MRASLKRFAMRHAFGRSPFNLNDGSTVKEIFTMPHLQSCLFLFLAIFWLSGDFFWGGGTFGGWKSWVLPGLGGKNLCWGASFATFLSKIFSGGHVSGAKACLCYHLLILCKLGSCSTEESHGICLQTGHLTSPWIKTPLP